ncbi:MAG TPA: asparagine synthase (glutamine-hydrolyzing) [Usitatibacter sp.]|nr:asparagine synthase (glutamine-hydrolyzing) [Usitatibacter sp.]
MCGITGYWVRRGEATRWLDDLAASVDTLRRRGPDDSGVWVRPGARVALGHTRLSILDLSRLGHQPMRTPDGALTMVFNGEVYNFPQVRAELESLGHAFRSSGDSEVVLTAIAQWGIKAVDRFVGMFAIAIWNERERRMLLIRDRMGVKPLYYAWNGQELWFGSELKALRAFQAWEPEIDRDAMGEYLQYGYVSAPRSIYKDVRKLPPGHWLELGEVGEPAVRKYWSPFDERPLLTGSEEDLERELEAHLIDAFRLRLVSDVPVGVFLSGGIDSTAVAAILQRYGGSKVHTFTIGFHDRRFDEAVHARQVAAHLGTQHTEQILNASDMDEVMPEWANLFDEPFGDSSGVPTYLVSRLARQHVKVALSADGGDELFNGYQHYGLVTEREQKMARLPQAARSAFSYSLGLLEAKGLRAAANRMPLPAGLRHATRRNVIERLEKLRVMLPGLDRTLVYDLAMTSWTPWEIERLLGSPTAPREAVSCPADNFPERMAYTDMRYFLPDDILVKVDRTTMATGLEGREPFLDHRLVEFALRLPLDLRRGPLGPKHLLRKVLYKHVPRSIVERPKQGFGIPLANWLRHELAHLIPMYLEPTRIREAGLFDPEMVARAVQNFREGGPGNDRLDVQRLWYLIAFEIWRERWLGRERPRRPRALHATGDIDARLAGD